MTAKEWLETKTERILNAVPLEHALIALELAELETKISCYRATGLSIEQYDCMAQLEALKQKYNIQ